MYSWMEVVNQWHEGILYPRWAAEAHWGYGEARFLFYPPGSWMLGASLGTVLPWKLVPGTYCSIALMLAGFSMHRLARQWLPARDALFAAAFYAVNPYHIVIVYWRSAFAELLAAALLPLLVLAIMNLREPGIRPVFGLAAVLAAAWLTNAPAAIMIHYSAAGLALLLTLHDRSWKPLLRGTFSVFLAAGLASFYLLPAIYEERWINIGEVLAAGVRPQDNFLFTNIADVEHNRFNFLVSTIGLAEIALLAIALWYSRAERVKNRALGLLIAAWGAATALFMFSISHPLWQDLPKFQFVQLPFRWLLCLNAALALLLAMAARCWLSRAVVAIATLAMVLGSAHRIQPPWWDTAADIQEMTDAMSDGTGNEGIDEYVPAGTDPYEARKEMPQVTTESDAAIPAKVTRWGAEDRQFVVHTAKPVALAVRLFDYPAWKTTVNGAPATTARSEDTGLLLVPVPAGSNEVQIHFTRTWDRQFGGIVSLISLLTILGTWLLAESQNPLIRAEQGLHFVKALRSRRTPTLITDVGKRVELNEAMDVRTVLIATSNPGKLRDFAGAAAAHGITIAGIPGFSSLPPVIEDGATFEANARKKAEAYSQAAPGELVLADDSGLEIDALNGAPGVHSARYAADEPHAAESNTDDDANNARVLRELKNVRQEKRTARFVCVIAAAKDGKTLQVFRGTAEGIILDSPRGHNGFGYDPLFYFAQINKTFAELTAEEKSHYSHRGAAFRAFLQWCDKT
jgi:non-canonical purine NTP pyrophosphatase (RdgB/HAM1 family)